MNKTWLLFEDGSHYSVTCDIHRTGNAAGRPSDAYIVTDHSGEFLIAARRAVSKVHHYCEQAGMGPGKVIADFDLSERVGYDGTVAGRSCGLSFAAAFAGRILPHDLPGIAATGEVCPDGRVGRVNGITAKLDAALRLLAEGDFLFFPRENLDDVPKTILLRMGEKKINWHAVAHVDEFMAALCPDRAGPGPGKKRVAAIVALVAVLAALAWFGRGALFSPPPERVTPPVPVSAHPGNSSGFKTGFD